MRLTDYLQNLQISQGAGAGEPLKLLPWQRKFLRGAFAPDVREAALSIGRGNGKSTLVAAIACGALDGPISQARAETVVVASSFAQGRIIFDHCKAFMGGKLADKRTWRVWDSTGVATIENRENGARLRCLGSDPQRAHGLAPGLVLCDEPAQWPEGSGEKMIAALRTARGKIPDSRLIALGTRPASSEHWFEMLISGGADYSQCHAAPADAPIGRRTTWVKANPSLRYMPDLESAIRAESARAKRDESISASFRALRLNQGVSDTAESTLVDLTSWRESIADAERSGPLVWGVDLGGSAAMSAVSGFWPESGRLQAFAAFASDPDLRKRGEQDNVGRLYQQCADRGEIMTSGGKAVDYVALFRAALTRLGRPAAIAADRWKQAELFDALKASGVPVCPVDWRGQGFRDGGEDVRTFRRALLEGRVRPVESLLLSAAMAEARVVSDPAGNSKLAKNAQGGRRLRARDDAAAAAILAVSLGIRRQPKPVKLRWA